MLEKASAQSYQQINDVTLTKSEWQKKKTIAGSKTMIFKHHNMI